MIQSVHQNVCVNTYSSLVHRISGKVSTILVVLLQASEALESTATDWNTL